MAAIDIVNRVFREFRRYTGDGLPNPPLNAPLPVGDPQSGPHNPKKVELREALLAPLQESASILSIAQSSASQAAASALDAANQIAAVIPSVRRFAVGGSVQSVDLGNDELHPAAVRVFISGVYQFSTSWSLDEGVLTPVGGAWPGNGIAENMEVLIDASSAIGFSVPSNGSVTRQKLSPGAVGEDEIDPDLLAQLEGGSASAIASGTPFGQGGMRVLVGLSNDAHHGFNSGILDVGGGKWVIVYRRAANHTVVNGSEIWAADTYDKGATLENMRVIYTDPNNDTRNFVARTMANGRMGIIASRRAAGTLAYSYPVFIYSDDGGSTWSSSLITPPAPGWGVNFHGNMIDYPASVGGDDALGFIAHSYGHTGGHIDAAYTTDNGNTWSWRTEVASPSGGVASLTEMAVSRVGNQNKWIMMVRQSGAMDAPGVAYASSNPLNFPTMVSTGLGQVGNPPQTIYDTTTGLFWYISYARRDRGWGRNPTVGIENVMLVAAADGDDLFAAGGDMSALGANWKIAAYLPDWASGYLHPYLIDGKWYGTFVCGEDNYGHAYSKLCLIGDFVPSGLDRANFDWMFQWSAVGSHATYRQGIEAGFGLTPPTERGYVTAGVASSIPGWVSETFTTVARTHQRFRNPNGIVGSVTTDASSTAFNTTSDGTLKIDRAPISEEIDLDAVWEAIEPLAYTMLSGADLSQMDGRWFGLIAQDLHKVWPQAVTPGSGIPGAPGFVPWAIDYSKVVPLILARQKQFEGRVLDRLAALEGISE